MKVYIKGLSEGIELPKGYEATAFFSYIEIRDKDRAFDYPALYTTRIPLPYDPMPIEWWRQQVKNAIKRIGNPYCQKCYTNEACTECEKK